MFQHTNIKYNVNFIHILSLLDIIKYKETNGQGLEEGMMSYHQAPLFA